MTDYFTSMLEEDFVSGLQSSNAQELAGGSGSG